MKRTLLLCVALSAALILVGCATHDTATTQSSNGMAQRGAINTGAGVGGGGSPGRTPIRHQP